MARQIRLVFPLSGVRVVATMLEEQTPRTCEAVWRLLEKPIDTKARFGQQTGPELYVLTPPAPGLPYENAQLFPTTGDLLFYHYDGQLPYGEVVYDIGIYYDCGGTGLASVGWVAGNLFATVTENLTGLQMEAKKVEQIGPQPIRVERVLP